MKDQHPSRPLLSGYLRDELPAPRRKKISLHVALCPVCQRRLGSLEQEADEAAGAVDYESAFQRVLRSLGSLKEGIDEEARRSASLLPELLQDPPDRRFERIAREPRFHALKLSQLLQDRSRSDWFEEPARSLESARLAVAIADRLNGARYGSSLVAEERARAWALLGNSWRINRRFKDAEQALGQASEHQQVTGNLLVHGEILAFKASLRFAQGHLQEVVELLDCAVAIAREAGDTLKEGRALTLKGRALKDAGRYRDALRVLCRAKRRIDPESEPEAEVLALHNLLACLADMGRPLEAQRLLASERHRYIDVGRRRLLTRLHCLEAQIAEGLGRLADATPLLWRARELYEEQQLPFDWALCSFQLATVLVRQGSLSDGRRLLDEVIPFLDSMEIQPEARTARMIHLWCGRA